MTAEIVNLRRARKKRDRAEREKAAEANRIAFGRSRAEQNATGAETGLRERQLDGHRRDRKPDGDSNG